MLKPVIAMIVATLTQGDITRCPALVSRLIQNTLLLFVCALSGWAGKCAALKQTIIATSMMLLPYYTTRFKLTCQLFGFILCGRMQENNVGRSNIIKPSWVNTMLPLALDNQNQNVWLILNLWDKHSLKNNNLNIYISYF